MMSLSLALLVAFVQESEVEPVVELEDSQLEHITATLPDYRWDIGGNGFFIYGQVREKDWAGWAFENERDGDQWTAVRPAGTFGWLMWGNRSSNVSAESIVQVCAAMSHVEDLGLDLTNRHSTPEEIEAIARAHPRLRGLILREAFWSTWAMTPESLAPLAPSLHRLSLDVVREVDDAYLARMLAPLKELRYVQIRGVFGPRTAEVLATLENLRTVELTWGDVSVEDLDALFETGRIEELRLYWHPRDWPDSGWSDLLAKASSLRGLGIALSSHDYDLLKQILELPNLEWLEIYETHGGGFERPLAHTWIIRAISQRPWKGLALPSVSGLDSDIVRRIADMPELEWLDLRAVKRIDSETLRMLEASKFLRSLDLPYTYADSSAIQRLITVNPKLRVHGGGYHWGKKVSLEPR